MTEITGLLVAITLTVAITPNTSAQTSDTTRLAYTADSDGQFDRRSYVVYGSP